MGKKMSRMSLGQVEDHNRRTTNKEEGEEGARYTHKSIFRSAHAKPFPLEVDGSLPALLLFHMLRVEAKLGKKERSSQRATCTTGE